MRRVVHSNVRNPKTKRYSRSFRRGKRDCNIRLPPGHNLGQLDNPLSGCNELAELGPATVTSRDNILDLLQLQRLLCFPVRPGCDENLMPLFEQNLPQWSEEQGLLWSQRVYPDSHRSLTTNGNVKRGLNKNCK